MRNVVIIFLAVISLGSCVGKKKYTQLQYKYEDLAKALQYCDETVKEGRMQNDSLRNALALCKSQSGSLEGQVEDVKRTNENLLGIMEQMSLISKEGAVSMQKSLEALQNQSAYIEKLTKERQKADSLTLALSNNLKRSLEDVNDKDIQIDVKKGVVYISISDNMLFQSGSAEIGPNAGAVLSKVARIINDRRDVEVLVEGHTDNVPITKNCFKDNWDLSAMRATSIVRTLQDQYAVSPSRMTAGARSEYVPKAPNDSETGRGINRRTEIILTPKLDQFFELLVPEEEGNK
ncbi:MAG: OmpA family protein [Saprospirales bacterium]|jgi:chemotaxis protein MotB|nr:OmpA family protein [Saprospirales bacterium]MBK6901302.1 OmpA family protein [Saprospirales bacterium]MBK7335967.1 OmpA family protein [Saprospirales bacterium]